MASVTRHVALIETAAWEDVRNQGQPLWAFRPGFDGDPTNYWYPTRAGLEASARFAGLGASRLVHDSGSRLTLATPPARTTWHGYTGRPCRAPRPSPPSPQHPRPASRPATVPGREVERCSASISAGPGAGTWGCRSTPSTWASAPPGRGSSRGVSVTSRPSTRKIASWPGCSGGGAASAWRSARNDGVLGSKHLLL